MLAVLGASHHDLGLTELAALADDPADLRTRLEALASEPDSPVAGLVLLATCNRVEVYLDADRFHPAVDAVTDVLSAGRRTGSLPPEAVAGLVQVRVGTAAATHLFAVAAGLDSMVVGEAEISGQVAAALRHAQAAHTATPTLNLLFQSASRNAKRVSTVTGLGGAGRSIAAVALDVAGESVSSWADADVLLIGTGSFARVVVAALRARGCGRIRVFSASGRAEHFAAGRGLDVVHRDGLEAALTAADLVVTASGSGRPVLDADLLRHVVAGRGGAALPIVDLALRPDLSADGRALGGIEVIDLHTAAARGGDRLEAVGRAEAMVLDAVAEFDDRLVARRLDPAVVALRAHVETAVARELDRLRPKVSPEVAAEFDQAAHRLARSILHTPTVRARALARTGSGEDYLRALHTLFGIEVGGD